MTLEFRGLKELRRDLKALPPMLKLDGGARVVAAANQAAADIRNQMPDHGTGNLKRGVGVRVQPAGSTHGARMQVRNNAPHAWLYENGTKPRKTRKGAYRGVMTAFHVFIPVMQERRRVLEAELRDVIKQAGLEVRG